MRSPSAPARLAALGLVLQAFGPSAAEDKLRCDAPVLEGGALKVAFSSQLNQDVCNYLEPPLTTAAAEQQCIDFCNLDGAQLGLPILLGTTEYGFNMEDMNQICLGSSEQDVIVNNQSRTSYCSARGNELHEIKLRSAEFVTSVEGFKAQQVQYRANMRLLSDDLQKKLKGEEFKAQMARETDKLQLLREQFETFASDAAALSSASSSLGRAMQDLTGRSQALDDTMVHNLDRFDEFISNCNLMLIGKGAQNEYLLDICAQGSQACVDETQGEHIGCCCGLNPITADGVFNIDGGGQVTPGRRLQGQRRQSLDVCAKARKDGSAAAEAFQAEMQRLSVGDLYDEYKSELEQNYADYSRMCLTTPSRRLEETGGASVGEGKPESASAEEVGRRLMAGGESCTPAVLAEPNLKVAFTSQTDMDICRLLEPKMDDARMTALCDSFCGPESVAMLMGTEAYGFSMDEANSVCLPPNGVLLHNETLLGQCRGWSDAFREIQVLTGRFTMDLEVFTAAAQLHTAANRKAVKDLQDYLKSTEVTNDIARASRSQKINKVEAAIRERLETKETTEARDILREKADQLRTSARDLSEKLNKNLPLINRFLNECNQLFTGVGAQREYLLDICAQGSSDCFDKGEAEHVSCVCTYSPLAYLGQTMSVTSIAGVSAIPEAWVRSGRRLSDSTPAADATAAAGVIDICAEAWTTAIPSIAGLRERIRQTGYDEVLTDYIDQQREAYGVYFCDYYMPPTTTTTATTNVNVNEVGTNGAGTTNGAAGAAGAANANPTETSSARAGSMPGFAAAAAMLVLQTRWGPQRIEAV